MKNFDVQPLDLMQFINTKYHEPFIHAVIEFDGEIDENRLAGAIKRLTSLFPLLRCVYNEKQNKYVENEHLQDGDFFKVVQNINKDEALTESLDMTKQLVLFTLSKNTLYITISHLLCDGIGFRDLLYLLCDLYNGKEKDDYSYLMNRDFSILTKNLKGKTAMTIKMLWSMMSGYKNKKVYDAEKTDQSCAIQKTIPSEIMDKVHTKAKSQSTTLNDVFLTAYARALNKLYGNNKVNLPCTVNLRRYAESECGIGNLGGNYNFNVKVKTHESFEKTLSKTHKFMQKQKSSKNDIAGPMLLVDKYNKSTLEKFLKLYGGLKTIEFTDYTNLGVLDANNLTFDGKEVKNAIMYSGLQKPPCFQIAVSSYKGATTLSILLNCSKSQKEKAQKIIETVAEEIISFA